MLTDIEIAQQAKLLPIEDIARQIGIEKDEFIPYGRTKGKVDAKAVHKRLADKPNGKLVLVTAINPTPAGEGKTTITIGLTQALHEQGHKVMAALREPSLGPVFGVKGGAAGGGYSQVVPMEEINLHFTGDLHAITAANNLGAALLDNHLSHGNQLRIDVNKIQWKRCLDMNDRALRNCVIGLGGKAHGVPREDHFQITVASEVMAILCLSSDYADLRERLSRIVMAYDVDGKPVTAGDLGAAHPMAALLKEAMLPNLVQTLNHAPVLIHGGPFANIAHGCNSVTATKLALKLADYVVTEAGFGADLGAEKFLDIKCRQHGLQPDAAVLVATVKALKYNGGVPKTKLSEENVEALEKGLCNLEKHIENLTRFGLPVVVALNRFATDTEAEIAVIRRGCERLGATLVCAEVFAKGAEGGFELADAVRKLLERGEKPVIHHPYELEDSYETKFRKLAQTVYGADDVVFLSGPKKFLKTLEETGYAGLPICVAKTQYSLSDQATLLGRPHGFKVTVRDATLSAGAGFVVLLTGSIMTMPGLPAEPAANHIDIDPETGKLLGLS